MIHAPPLFSTRSDGGLKKASAPGLKGVAEMGTDRKMKKRDDHLLTALNGT